MVTRRDELLVRWSISAGMCGLIYQAMAIEYHPLVPLALSIGLTLINGYTLQQIVKDAQEVRKKELEQE